MFFFSMLFLVHSSESMLDPVDNARAGGNMHASILSVPNTVECSLVCNQDKGWQITGKYKIAIRSSLAVHCSNKCNGCKRW